MGGKLKIQPISRVGLDPLVDMAEQLRALLPGWTDTAPAEGRARVPSPLARDLAHLARHDADGLFTASIGDEVVGFGVNYVRGRQLLLAQLWLLPDFVDHPVAAALVRRALVFGDRAAAQDYSAHVLGGAPHEALLFRFGFRPRFPVYRLVLPAEQALDAGRVLAAALPGGELTQDAMARRVGFADLERLDRLTRGVTRPMDHEYWVNERGLRLATVRDGKLVAGYAYGGQGQCGPVVASTGEGAMAALGWSLQFAAHAGDQVEVLVPAVFETAVETLLETGAQCPAAGSWMSRAPVSGLNRCVLPGVTLF